MNGQMANGMFTECLFGLQIVSQVTTIAVLKVRGRWTDIYTTTTLTHAPERQSNTKQHSTTGQPFSKITTLGVFQAGALPTELPRQLRWLTYTSQGICKQGVRDSEMCPVCRGVLVSGRPEIGFSLPKCNNYGEAFWETIPPSNIEHCLTSITR